MKSTTALVALTLILLAGLLAVQPASGADESQLPLILTRVDPAEAQIRIDGKLDEAVWSRLTPYDNMVVIEPDTLASARFPTESRLFYTTRGLYLGIHNLQATDTLVARLSSRDQWINRDGIAFAIDTSGEGLYGYEFGLNLGGTQMDSTILPERQYNNEWDGPWQGATAVTSDGWSGELFIPWSMMTMPGSPGERKVGIYISRRVSHLDEEWGWPALPTTRSTFLSGFQPVSLQAIDPRQQFTFYPYASATSDRTKQEQDGKAGFDLYWRPSSNLQLSTTILPDFGNVESDNVVVNLTSFETFYPEKRAFFLEGLDLFITTPRAEVYSGGSRRFSPEPTTLLNTRRIGGAPRTPAIPTGVVVPATELSQPTELLGAFKVTGQQGKLRYGGLAAFEDDTVFAATLNGDPYRLTQEGREFGVARVLYEDTSGGDRRALGWMATVVSHPDEDAMVHSLDGHYLSRNRKWVVDSQLMRSDVDGTVGAGGFVDVRFVPHRGLSHTLKLDYLSEDLDITGLGYVRRNDAINFNYTVNKSDSNVPRLKNRILNMFISQEYNTDGMVVRSGLFTRTNWILLNNMRLSTEVDWFPDRWDDWNSDGNGAFRIKERWVLGLGWSSDSARELSLQLDTTARGEELGGWNYSGAFGLTWRPSDRVSILFDLQYFDREGWLIHWTGRKFTTYNAVIWQPFIETNLFLSAKQQLRMTAQWAGIKAHQRAHYEIPAGDGELLEQPITPTSYRRDFSISRLTFQLRYRWEIAPLSDLFVVYTRGANLPSAPDEEFTELLRDSWSDQIIDLFVIKLRYRLGN